MRVAIAKYLISVIDWHMDAEGLIIRGMTYIHTHILYSIWLCSGRKISYYNACLKCILAEAKSAPPLHKFVFCCPRCVVHEIDHMNELIIRNY